jgi:hypothetical protein
VPKIFFCNSENGVCGDLWVRSVSLGVFWSNFWEFLGKNEFLGIF